MPPLQSKRRLAQTPIARCNRVARSSFGTFSAGGTCVYYRVRSMALLRVLRLSVQNGVLRWSHMVPLVMWRKMEQVYWWIQQLHHQPGMWKMFPRLGAAPVVGRQL